MSDEKYKCVICDGEIDPENESYLCHTDGDMHEECAIGDYPSTLIKITPDGVENYKFSRYYHYESEYYEFEEGTPHPIKLEKWVATDGWRGYTEWEYEDGYEIYSEGAILSGRQKAADLNELYEKLHSREIVPPCPIYWIFGTTSNVSSTVSTILIKSTDKAEIEKWLTEVINNIEGTIFDEVKETVKDKIDNMFGF